MGWILMAVIVLVVIGLGIFVFMGFRTSDTTAQVSGAHWERSIDIIAPVPVRSSAWRDQLPAAAANVSCRQEFRYTSSEPVAGAREVCGTPYTVDTGTGMGRVVQDCEYQVYDDMCSYTTLQLGRDQHGRLARRGLYAKVAGCQPGGRTKARRPPRALRL